MIARLQTPAKAEPAPSFTPVRAGRLQRYGATTECNDCRNKRLALQRSATNHAESLTAPPIVHEVLHSPGQPLDAQTRALMEPCFGRDFSRTNTGNVS